MKKSLFVMIVTFFVINYTRAQYLFVAQNAQVYVNQQTTITINGSIVTNGFLKNMGTIRLARNITVNGTYQSQGQDVFYGDSSQYILTSVTGVNYFGYLVKTNTGSIILNGSIDTDSISFNSDGFIKAGSNQVIIKSADPHALSGFNPSRYILLDNDLGMVSRNIGSLTNYSFPVGTNTAGYRRFDIAVTSLGTTGTAFIHLKAKDFSPGTITYQKFFSSGFNGIFPGTCSLGSSSQWVQFTCMTDHYWKISGPVDYEFKTYAYATPCSPLGQGPRRVIKSPAGLGNWTVYVDSVAGTLTDELCLNTDWTAAASVIPGGTYRGFGDFAITGGFGSLLPIELLYLLAKPIDDQFIRLTWETASESNNKDYQLQRSSDAIHWYDIVWVTGHGTTHQQNSYLFDDMDVLVNVLYYYRLKQNDYDGTSSYSNIVTAQLLGSGIKVSNIYPNPSTQTQWVRISLPQDEVITFSCIDDIGNEIWNKKVSGVTGNQDIVLNDVPSGWYVLRIQIGNEFFNKKYIKQ